MPNIANNNTSFQSLLAIFHEPFHEKVKTLHFIYFYESLDMCDCVM